MPYILSYLNIKMVWSIYGFVVDVANEPPGKVPFVKLMKLCAM